MLELNAITKSYRTSDVETLALNGVDLQIGPGEFVAIMGPSGCGKSTLLNVLGLLDRPTGGSFRFGGEEIASANESRLTSLRREKLGFIFQNFNLIDDMTVVENVEVALAYRGKGGARRRRQALSALEEVGIAHRANHRPKQLSGGQQQRVAVARALVSSPAILLADEPTGNLDTENGRAVMDLLHAAVARGVTVVMVTHSPDQAAEAGRIIRLLDGRLVDQSGQRE